MKWLAAFCLVLVTSSFAIDTLTPPPEPIPPTFFGMHIHGITVPRPYSGKVTPWPSMKFGTWRLWDAYVTWKDVEPQPGEWKFQNLDKYVDLAERNGVDILLTLGKTPEWASSARGKNAETAPPKNIEDWKTFVRTVASRYKGRIHAYEVWNEPNAPNFWSGTTQQLVQVTHHAYTVLKWVDPTITVVSPSYCWNFGVPGLDSFLRAGGGQFADVIGYHLYVYPSPPEAMVPVAQQVESVMRRDGVGDKPLWNTEIGWAKPKPSSDEEAAGFVMRTYLLGWAAGVSREYWFGWDQHTYALQLVDMGDQALTPAGQAYAEIEQWLTGKRMNSCHSSGDVWVVELEDTGHPVKIVWDAGGSSSFRIPNDWRATRVTDFRGKTQPVRGGTVQIGPAPVLLT
jgi:Glycosyl hydrolases family 39